MTIKYDAKSMVVACHDDDHNDILLLSSKKIDFDSVKFSYIEYFMRVRNFYKITNNKCELPIIRSNRLNTKKYFINLK